jgi:peptidoglycan/LPS O-acetylase OafA/YrhL
MIAGYFIYSAQDFASLGATAIAATLSFVNIKLLFRGNYFTISPDAQPLIHYWSLAVEEQFYVVFPIWIFGVMRLTRHSLAAFLVCLFLSFAACVLMTPYAPTASFYLLPTRARGNCSRERVSLLQEGNIPNSPTDNPLFFLSLA